MIRQPSCGYGRTLPIPITRSYPFQVAFSRIVTGEEKKYTNVHKSSKYYNLQSKVKSKIKITKKLKLKPKTKIKNQAAPKYQPQTTDRSAFPLLSCIDSKLHRPVHRNPPHVPRPPGSLHPHLERIRSEHKRDVPSRLLICPIGAGFRRHRDGVAFDLYRLWCLPAPVCGVGSVAVLGGRGGGCGGSFGFKVDRERDACFVQP